MKHFIRTILISLLFLSSYSIAICQDGHEVIFKIPVTDDVKGKIGYFEGSNIVYVDSSYFRGNTIIFKSQNLLKEGLYLLQYRNKSIEFIVSEQKFSFEAPASLEVSDIIVIQSLTNTIFYNYKKMVDKQKKTITILKNKNLNNNSTVLLKDNIRKIGRKVQKYRDSIYVKYPENLACIIIKAGLEVKVQLPIRLKHSDTSNGKKLSRDHLSDNFKWSDERMIRTPFLEDLILKSLKLTPLVPDSLAKTCDILLKHAEANKMVYEYTLNFLKNYFEKSNRPWMDVLYTYIAKKYILDYNTILADSSEILTIKANVKRLEPILTGKIAPEINFMDSSGIVIPLHSVIAKYTILYFWDADCNHCLEVTPQLWEYYKSFKNQEVEVYAVTIQQVWFSWKAYLKKHKLTWINVFDPIQIPEIYKTYQVGTTPNIYLLDKDKRILCKRLTLEELKIYLSMLRSTNP